MEKRDLLKLLATGGIATATAAITAKQLTPESFTQNIKLSDTAFDRVMKTGVLRCGYLVYAPNFMVDPNTGEFSGAFYELTESIGRTLGVKIDWVEEGSLISLTQSLHNGRIDAVCSGLWSNAVRSKVLDYGRPVFFNVLGLYARADDTRFDHDYSKLNHEQYKIAVLDGEMADQIAQSDFPRAQRVALPQLSQYSQLLLDVATGKADATIAATHEMIDFEKYNPGVLKKVDVKQPIRTFPNVFFFNKGEAKLVSLLNDAIDEMEYKGFVDNLVDKYEPGEGVFYRTARPYRQFPMEAMQA